MLVDNATLYVKTVPIQDSVPLMKDGKPTRHEKTGSEREFSPPSREITLKPGINKVDEKDWAKMQALKTVRVYIEEGDLVALDGVEPAKATPKNAIAIIKKTFDGALLTRWRADERAGKVRDTVLAAIDKQLSQSTITEDERRAAKDRASREGEE
jgi:hypothetical protein